MIAHSDLAVLEREDTDEALVERVRAGDNGAFEDLYRRHSGLAVSVARKMLRSPQDAEDAAAEAFTNVLSALRRQVGPREMFRPYLLACVKNTCLQRIRQRSKQACTRDRSLVDVERWRTRRSSRAPSPQLHFSPCRCAGSPRCGWRRSQHLDPVTIAERLDVNVPSAGALVYRARQGFTEAYLAQHLSRAGKPACAALGPKLAQYVRGTAGLMASRQVQHHIEECSACAAAIAELSDVNSSLRSLTGPALVSAVGSHCRSGRRWLGNRCDLGVRLADEGRGDRGIVDDAVSRRQRCSRVGGRHWSGIGQRHAPDTHRTRHAGDACRRSVRGDRGHVAVPGPADATSGHVTPTPGHARRWTDGQRRTARPRGRSTDDTGRCRSLRRRSARSSPMLATALATTALSSLPELPSIPSIVLPEIGTPAIATPAIPVLPEITIPAISLLPGVVIPEITVPAITVPAVSVPAITIPQVSIPAISLPSIPSLIGPLDRHISVTLGG